MFRIPHPLVGAKRTRVIEPREALETGYENTREAAFMFCAHLDIEALAKKVEVKYIFCL